MRTLGPNRCSKIRIGEKHSRTGEWCEAEQWILPTTRELRTQRTKGNTRVILPIRPINRAGMAEDERPRLTLLTVEHKMQRAGTNSTWHFVLRPNGFATSPIC